MKKQLLVILLVLWVMWGPINWGAVLGDYTAGDASRARRYYGVALTSGLCGIVLGPIAGVAIMCGTNVYEHGFVWTAN